ncbi:hypothetical protein PPSIR1_20564 [Plesiocystis pacifica SIR-1]|uniref:Uncharacterized protein n=1 Tax=Plesiocystis pacifica SIR-1 TaxID=391625 RepID=A6G289_9BACT|nr:hypothetical protein PPSIR1_20564 [Plesiocystis pacifica SIR-1]
MLRGNAITRLRGVDVKQLVWIPASSIDREGDGLVFGVGPVRQRLPTSAFP